MLIIAILMVFVAAYVLLTGLTVRQREVAVSVRRARRYGARDQREIDTRRSVNDRLVGPLTNKFANLTLKLMPKTDPQQIHAKLRAGGLGQSMTPQMYLAIKGALIAVSVFFGLVLGIAGAIPLVLGLGVAACGSAIG